MATLSRLCLAAVLGLVLAGLRPGAAHEFSPAYLGFDELTPGVFRVQWKVSLTGGLADALTPQLPESCAFAGTLSAYVMGDARVQQRDLDCDSGLRGQTLGVRGLAGTMTDVLVHIAYLDGGSHTLRLTPAAPAAVVPAAQGIASVMAAYLLLGTAHILAGIDHLLFVLALILLVGSVRRLIITVTAFTIAHSITLGAATLGWIALPQSPVEAVIALSILFLAAELARRGRSAGCDGAADLTARFPWLVAFVFGLLHGFGFAGALAEVGLPQSAVPVALLFFNLGVELGQLAFIAAVLGAAWGWRRAGGFSPRAWRVATAYGLGSVAAFWLLERTFGAL